jgi:hypothetical protein
LIAFGNFEPDRLIYASGVSVNAVNCIPVADGWGPLPQTIPFSDPLPAACTGAFYVRTTLGGYRIFAGTATALYEFDASDFGWDDVSRTGDPYAVPEGDQWWFAVFGTFLLAGNLGTDMQVIDIDLGTEFDDQTGSPPKSRYAWLAGSQLVLAHLDDAPNRVMTSGIGDATFWTPGRRGCDFQDFPDGEEIVGGVGAQGGAVIFQRTKIRSMTMLPGDVAFRTDVLNSERGVVAPLSIAQTGPGQFVYLSHDGFFANVEGRAIGLERVDRWYRGMIDQGAIAQVKAMVDPVNKIVWWQSPMPGDEKFLLGYCWPLDRWCYATASITNMASLVTAGVTIDGVDAFFDSMDEIPVPFDSVLWTGGIRTLAVFDDEFRMCFFAGTSMAATLETADAQLVPGRRSFVSEARVVGDVPPRYTLRTITSDWHGGTRTEGATKTPNTYTGIVPFRSEALLHAFRVEIPEGDVWHHVSGVDFPEDGVRAGGKR